LIEQNTTTGLRSKSLLEEHKLKIWARTDRMFAGLMLFQWLAGIAISLILSPRTWSGTSSQTHPHVWFAIFLGGAIGFPPIILAITRPGRTITRHVIAAAQMLFSALLIHLTGGRIETHFHVFGSLAFLAVYRDWRVLITSTVVVAVDHLVRGIFLPQSVYGVFTASPWRSLEHASWVLFEDFFLIRNVLQNHREMAEIAERRAQLENTNALIEQQVQDRTSELRASESRTRLIVDTALDSVINSDAEGTIIGWNPQAEATFGWTQNEALGQKLADTIVPPSLREAHNHGMKRFKETGQGEILNRRIELIALHRDGREFPVEMSLAPVESNGSVTFSAFVRDITERKQTEVALASARDAAVEAARMKSEFLANMSHEIRTPMNGVIGMTELLLGSELGADQREFAETIRNSAEALLTVLNDILDFSKMEAGKLSIEHTAFDVREQIEEVGALLSRRAHEKGIELLTCVPPDFPTGFVGDPTRIRQVLMNLIGNAIKFTDKGEVVVSAAISTALESGPGVRFEVRDSGIGVSEDQKESIFQSFTQADGSTTRKYGGTGLGLTISRKLVDLMDGVIGIDSEPGKGSTFWIELPLTQGSPIREIPNTPVELKGLSVLIVDDHPLNRRILREQLSAWEMAVEEAVSGAAALELVEQWQANPFSIILVDNMMPEMSGLELATRLKAEARCPRSALVLLSSAADTLGSRELAEHGFASSAMKPVRQEQLRRALVNALNVLSSHKQEPVPVVRPVEAANLGLRVLLAEDNTVNQKVAARLLERMGCTVDIAGNGLIAVEKSGEQHYDVILMDVQMPEMGGFDATKIIRAKDAENGHRNVIIAMTAHALEGDRERCIGYGMDDYLTKPVKPELLESMLLKWSPMEKAA
jgi:two-component system sensor histidine kinase/response regulator